MFDNPDGTGAPVAGKRAEDGAGDPLASSQQTVAINVGGSLAADRTYYFRVIATDPTGSNVPFSTQTPLPPFFTGAQAIGDAFVLPFAQTAQVFWGANVMGRGRVEILSPAGLGPFNDGLNVQDHSLLLTGLQPATTYQYRISWLSPALPGLPDL